MGWVYAIIALVAISAGTTAVLTYNHAISRAETAEEAADGWAKRAKSETKRADRLQGDANASQKLAIARGTALRDSNRRLDAANELLASLEAADPVARDQLATPLVDSVRLLRRRNAGCSLDLSVPCTPRAIDPPGGTSASGQDDQGAAAGKRQGEGSVPAERKG